MHVKEVRHCPGDDKSHGWSLSRVGCEAWIKQAKPGAGRQVMMVLVGDGGEVGSGAMGRKVTFMGLNQPSLVTSGLERK